MLLVIITMKNGEKNMTIEERKLTPAGQGNLQQIKLGIPVVEALNRMAEDPMGENEKLLLRILEQNKDTEYGRKYGFANIHSIEEYQKKVPVSVYVIMQAIF